MHGSKVISAGHGCFVPKDEPWADSAGPEGVVILEFRRAGSFDMQFAESPERWERSSDTAREHAPEWRGERLWSVTPGERATVREWDAAAPLTLVTFTS